jgi:hypothetical protein
MKYYRESYRFLISDISCTTFLADVIMYHIEHPWIWSLKNVQIYVQIDFEIQL